MSDLAPLVGATIRDKVVQDLMEEVSNLQKERNQLLEVKVKNKDGVVLCSRSIKDARWSGNSSIILDFEQIHRTEASCGTVNDIDDNFPDWTVSVGGVIVNPNHLFGGYEGDPVSATALEYLDGNRGLFDFTCYPAGVGMAFSVKMTEAAFAKITDGYYPLCCGMSFSPIRKHCPLDTSVEIEHVMIPAKSIDSSLHPPDPPAQDHGEVSFGMSYGA